MKGSLASELHAKCTCCGHVAMLSRVTDICSILLILWPKSVWYFGHEVAAHKVEAPGRARLECSFVDIKCLLPQCMPVATVKPRIMPFTGCSHEGGAVSSQAFKACCTVSAVSWLPWMYDQDPIRGRTCLRDCKKHCIVRLCWHDACY